MRSLIALALLLFSLQTHGANFPSITVSSNATVGGIGTFGSIVTPTLQVGSLLVSNLLPGLLYFDGVSLTNAPAIVTATTYGDSTHFPVITTDADGRVSNVTTNAVIAAIAEGTLTHAGTVTLSFANVLTKNFLSLTGNVTFAFSNVTRDNDYRLRVYNPQATNITLTFPSGVNTTTNWVGGAPNSTMLPGTEAIWSMSVCGGTADGNVKSAWGQEL
jgi:hypothetical protein